MWSEYAEKIHQNAVEHGWWDEPRSFGEIVALIHSELSEALEEIRAKRPAVWYGCTEADPEKPCIPEDQYDCLNFDRRVECEYRSAKPEGITVELADTVIRILDWFGHEELDADALISAAKKKSMCDVPCKIYDNSLGDLIARWHLLVSLSYACWCRSTGKYSAALRLALCVGEICDWSKANNIDLNSIICQKHEYNKTRPFRHGGKAL